MPSDPQILGIRGHGSDQGSLGIRRTFAIKCSTRNLFIGFRIISVTMWLGVFDNFHARLYRLVKFAYKSVERDFGRYDRNPFQSTQSKWRIIFMHKALSSLHDPISWGETFPVGHGPWPAFSRPWQAMVSGRQVTGTMGPRDYAVARNRRIAPAGHGPRPVFGRS